jgi:glycosyltransferase involved in cell wall biosynthesis
LADAPTTPRRLAIILPDLRGGGAERVALTLAEAFVALGNAVDLVVMNARGEFVDALPGGVQLVDLKAARARNAVGPLAAYLRQERPAAIIANMWPLTALAWLSNRMAGRPSRMAGVDHNILSRSLAPFGASWRLGLRLSIRAAYPLFDARIAVSAGVADDVAALGGIPRQSMTVIYNPVPPPASAKPMEGEDAIWGVPSGRRILSVGTLKPQKNHALLIRAFARMPSRKDCRLVILGDGPLRGALERLAQEEGVADRVSLPGFFTSPDAYYRSADLFALASDYEGFGNVLVEALGHGLPVVSTDCPSGPAEVLEHGHYGRLTPPGDAGALALAMEAALAAEPDRAALRARAAAFAPELIARQYLAAIFPDERAAPARAA